MSVNDNTPANGTGKRRARVCPVCGKPRDERYDPFCSKRCADVDLNRWLKGIYAVPVTEDEEEDERRNDDEGTPP